MRSGLYAVKFGQNGIQSVREENSKNMAIIHTQRQKFNFYTVNDKVLTIVAVDARPARIANTECCILYTIVETRTVYT